LRFSNVVLTVAGSGMPSKNLKVPTEVRTVSGVSSSDGIGVVYPGGTTSEPVWARRGALSRTPAKPEIDTIRPADMVETTLNEWDSKDVIVLPIIMNQMRNEGAVGITHV
jgi:hypothetical protein